MSPTPASQLHNTKSQSNIQVQHKNTFNKQIKIRVKVKVCLLPPSQWSQIPKTHFFHNASDRWKHRSTVLQHNEIGFEYCIVFRNWSFSCFNKDANQYSDRCPCFCEIQHGTSSQSESLFHYTHTKWKDTCELLLYACWRNQSFTGLSQAFVCERDEWNYILFLLLCVVEHDGKLSSVQVWLFCLLLTACIISTTIFPGENVPYA